MAGQVTSQWIRLLAAVALASFACARARAAACCGGHAAITSLITGDERARFASSLSQTQVIANAPPDGRAVFRDDGNRPARSALNLAGSWSFASRWQVGAALPIGLGSPMGDVQASLGWTALEGSDVRRSFSKMILFTSLAAPTGSSPDDVQFIDEGQVTGGGFYRVATGALALGTHRFWDFFSLAKASVGFARSFDDGLGSGQQKTVDPGWEGDVTVGLGYAVDPDWRIGGSLTSTFNEGFRVRSANGVGSTLSRSLSWPLDLQVAWFFSRDAVAALAYTDETVVGPAQNAVLTRAVSLQFGFRWGRE